MSDGVFCSTAGRVFTSKTAFTEHYRSDFHLYNLKRRVAGLPPVTREWFEERKAQILASASVYKKPQIWTDPLTKKKFQSEATYNVYIQSKKYQTLLKKAQLDQPPTPTVAEKPNRTGGESEKSEAATQKEWDVTLSLFDGHKSDSLEANLEYMFKRFAFYLPSSEFLTDAKGLLLYLGAKLQDGHIPLYCSGLDPDAKQLGSLQAVQNHMIDVNKCTMCFDDNEEEYAPYYDLDALFESGAGAELALADDLGELAGFELTVRDADGRAKILGNREFRTLYRQRHRPYDIRESVQTGRLVAKYRALGVCTREVVPSEVRRARKTEAARQTRARLKTDLRSNINHDLPRNVPY